MDTLTDEQKLRDALHNAKRACEPYCVERRMGSGEWDRCSCGTVEHNRKIDEALRP